MTASIMVDSSAALAKYHKVNGEENPSDALHQAPHR